MSEERTSAVDEREAVFLRWFAAAGVSDPETFTPTATIFASWLTFAGTSTRRCGLPWFGRRMRAAGVAPHRTNRAKGFRFRLTNIDEIAQNITAATKARAQARSARNGPALAAAVRAQLEAKRQAGALLDAGVVVPPFHIGDAAAEYCLALARLTDERFEKRVQIAINQAIAAMTRPPSDGPLPQIRTVLTDWFVDDDGVQTRWLTAVDANEGANADGRALKNLKTSVENQDVRLDRHQLSARKAVSAARCETGAMSPGRVFELHRSARFGRPL